MFFLLFFLFLFLFFWPYYNGFTHTVTVTYIYEIIFNLANYFWPKIKTKNGKIDLNQQQQDKKKFEKLFKSRMYSHRHHHGFYMHLETIMCSCWHFDRLFGRPLKIPKLYKHIQVDEIGYTVSQWSILYYRRL